LRSGVRRTITRRHRFGRFTESGSAETRLARPRVMHHEATGSLAHHRAVPVAVRGGEYRPQDHQSSQAEGPEERKLPSERCDT
jgi:hypothetical protein